MTSQCPPINIDLNQLGLTVDLIWIAVDPPRMVVCAETSTDCLQIELTPERKDRCDN
jgi:hypothetical protein